MKNITIAGTIGRDAETRQAGNSTATGFSVAVDDGWGENKRTLWFDCTLWGSRGEKLAPHLSKGGKVAVSGSFATREHNGKTYLQVNAAEVTLMGGVQRRDEPKTRNDYGEVQRQGEPHGAPLDRHDNGGHGGGSGALDDEIPFSPEARG